MMLPNAPRVLEIAEGKEVEDFWALLGGEGPYLRDEAPRPPQQPPRLFALLPAEVSTGFGAAAAGVRRAVGLRGAGGSVGALAQLALRPVELHAPCQADLHWDGGFILDAGYQLFAWLGPAWQQGSGGGSTTSGSTGGTGFFGLHARVAGLAETEAEAVAASELLGALELGTAFAHDLADRPDSLAIALVCPGDEPDDFKELFPEWDLRASLASIDPYEAALQRLRTVQLEASARGGGAVASKAAIAHELQQTIEAAERLSHAGSQHVLQASEMVAKAMEAAAAKEKRVP
ncbi:hypothetical protein T492DRAFT_117842 [Pavlovales sp. CCMP2436]|nr:hypothetical protein T492DRAFT_117842 [Pavlovales sp. CCMP2436]